MKGRPVASMAIVYHACDTNKYYTETNAAVHASCTVSICVCLDVHQLNVFFFFSLITMVYHRKEEEI